MGNSSFIIKGVVCSHSIHLIYQSTIWGVFLCTGNTSDITDNSEVPAYTYSYDYELKIVLNKHPNVIFKKERIGGCCPVLIYIQHHVLYCVPTTCGRLCCGCCRASIPFSDIEKIEVFQDGIAQIGNNGVRLNPGVRITCIPTAKTTRVIAFNTQDAQEFGRKLFEYKQR